MRQQGGFFYWVKIIIILAIIGAGFFCGQKVLAGQSILISEIIAGIEGNTNYEFIELYNPTDNPVNLTDWVIKKRSSTGAISSLVASSRFQGKTILPHKYFLITNEGGYNGSVLPDIVWPVSYNMAYTNNAIILYNKSEIIDEVAYEKIEIGKSLERQIVNSVMQDTDNNANDFTIQDSPTPHNSNFEAVNPPDPPLQGGTENPPESAPTNPPNPLYQVGETSPASTTPSQVRYNFGDVLINELVSDPADNEVEWIELYNRLNKEIDLTGWRLEDGSIAKTSLSGNLVKYKVIEKPNGNLNNDGDIIILYDASGKIIDQVAYGNWNDGNTTDNAPVAHDPDSLARKSDGYNTYNNLNDFAVTLKSTKGSANIIETEAEVNSEAKAGFDFSSDIYLSEILPNPAGDDTKLEFIEIYNAGRREVNLTGWSLSNEDNKKINLEKIATSTKIQAGEYLALYRPKTKIVLHNDQGQVKLFEPLADKPFISLDYKNVKEGWSYNLNNPPNPLYQGGIIKGEWVWSQTVTPGVANIIKAANQAPEVEFNFESPSLIGVPVIFDSTDTADVDDEVLQYAWDFGDGLKNNLANPEHTYLKTGIYKVRLEVSDGLATSTKEKSIKVVSSLEANLNVETLLTPLLKGGEDDIIINEVFPNPAGADTGQEWLELKNSSETEINLLNWRVENENGKYKFTDAQILKVGDFYVLDNTKSKLAFKNTDDVINLYNDLDELVDTVAYTNAVQGEAYALGANGKWFWTTKATPAEENIISLADSAYAKAAAGKAIIGNAENYVETDLEKIRELEIGSLVKVKGTVAVPPGILGVQIFYIVGSPGIQIYNYKKDFPALRAGDYIEVTGELAQTQGEFRIKTKDKSGINLLEHKAVPVALAVKADEVSEENIGQLITISGEITDKKSSSLYVDDGSGEVFVYIKQNTGIDTKNLAAGQKVSVAGILSKTQTGLRLLPRYPGDIALVDRTDALEPRVLGETIDAAEWDLAERNKKLELFKYLLIISGGVIILLVGLFIKVKRKV